MAKNRGKSRSGESGSDQSKRVAPKPASPPDKPEKKLLPPQPNLPVLIASAICMVSWMIFLLYVAVS